VSTWHLECSACGHQEAGDARATVCSACGQPYLVRFDSPPQPRTAVTQRWDMWRYAKVMPLVDSEQPVSLGEGLTPMYDAPRLAKESARVFNCACASQAWIELPRKSATPGPPSRQTQAGRVTGQFCMPGQ